MFELYKNIQTDFLRQTFLELFPFKARSLFLGHLVFFSKTIKIQPRNLDSRCRDFTLTLLEPGAGGFLHFGVSLPIAAVSRIPRL